MRTSKKEHYEKSVYAGIHTISGTSQKEVERIDATIEPCIKSCSQRKVRGQDASETYLQMNLNKHTGENVLITRFSEFDNVLEAVLDGVGLKKEDFTISRADMSFNSNNEQDYHLYQKLHRLLICCLADAYSFKNCYQTYDLWSYKSLNVAIRNDEYEAENYDKEAESNGKSEIKNRLELRSKRMKNSTLQKEFMEKWFVKLDKAITRFEDVQQRYNMELERLYKEDLERPKKHRRYYNLTAFLLQYQECIFCTKQMVDLLSRFDEVKNPESRAKAFKRTHSIEYFSKSDLGYITDVLKKKTVEYFRL